MTTRRLALFCITALIQSASVRAGIIFEFNADGVLPSSQGATYFAGGSPLPPEASVYSVAGGLLRQDTRGFARGDYFVNGVYDSTFETTLEWKALVYSSRDSATMRIESGTSRQYFTMNNDGIAIGQFGGAPNSVLMNTTDAFHVYRAVIAAGATSYQFYVDGVLRFSGSMIAKAPSDNFIEWGDFSGFTDTGRVDWDYVRLTAVPEPSNLVSAALGLAALAGYAGWRRARPRRAS